MAEDTEALAEERRKLLAKSLPFMLNAAWEAHSILSPAGIASRAVSEYQKFEKNTKLQRDEIKSLTKQIDSLDIQAEETGRISLSLTRAELLELVGNYLVSQFLNVGSAGVKFSQTSNGDYDGILRLPDKSIFAKLIQGEIDQQRVFSEADKAESLNPSEVWIFTHDASKRSDIRFGPIFVSENKILRGRFRAMPVTDIFSDITKGRFSALIESEVRTGSEEPKTRFVFFKRPENARA
ncbi:MAG: hypothetical protein JRN15_02205 [Nitrososphaerota archaeon]|jgi:hypothetical protein|nr:hypothetical protein [Nitrososphaerota archaeon]